MYRLSFPIELALALLVIAAPAQAQRANGPYAGLFGGGAGAGEVGQSLQFRGSLFGAWDRAIVGAEDRAARDSRWLDDRVGAGAHAGLSYLRQRDGLRFAAGGGSQLRVYPHVNDLTAVGHTGNAAFDIDLGSAITVKATGLAGYSSFYQFAPFLDAGIGDVSAIVPGFEFAAATLRNAQIAAGAAVVVATSRRSTVTADAGWNEWRFLDRSEFTLETRSASTAFRHQTTRSVGVRAGGGYQQARYGPFERVEMVTIDVGADYRDTLAFARRTAVSFGSSTSAVRIESQTHFRLNGSLGLTRGFKRTWSAFGGYSRTTAFLVGFRAPVLSDAVHVAVGGLLHPRLQWRTGAGYSRGSVGFEGSDSFSTYSGATRFEMGLLQQLGIYAQYAYYHYRVPQGSAAAHIVPRFARQAVTAGLVVWVPIVSDLRNPRDTR